MFILSLDKLVIETSVKPTVTGFLPFKGLYGMNTFYFFFFFLTERNSNQIEIKLKEFASVWFIAGLNKNTDFSRDTTILWVTIFTYTAGPLFSNQWKQKLDAQIQINLCCRHLRTKRGSLKTWLSIMSQAPWPSESILSSSIRSGLSCEQKHTTWDCYQKCCPITVYVCGYRQLVISIRQHLKLEMHCWTALKYYV